MIGRREMLAGTVAVAAAGLGAGPACARAFVGDAGLRAAIVALEGRSGGRLGVAVRDRATGAMFDHAGGVRFPMCSTFKVPLVAAVLHRVDRGQVRRDRPIRVTRADLVPHAPFCETRVGRTATVMELCAAAAVLSDNVAANLLLAIVGGPAGLTAFLRATGDPVTRLDRTEPALNSAVPGDLRDTTTPDAMVAGLDRLLLGSVLGAGSRALLTDWMAASRTGDRKYRAGVPRGWRVADKTGRGERGTNNDVGLLWPPVGPAIVIASFLTATELTVAAADAVHRDIARAVATAVLADRAARA